MVDKSTFNSRATALVDISPVSMPITRSLKTAAGSDLSLYPSQASHSFTKTDWQKLSKW